VRSFSNLIANSIRSLAKLGNLLSQTRGLSTIRSLSTVRSQSTVVLIAIMFKRSFALKDHPNKIVKPQKRSFRDAAKLKFQRQVDRRLMDE